MANELFVVAGATGNIGSKLAEKLLAKGAKVRALGRDSKKLAALAAKGAETATADVGDTKALAAAFKGAKGVFLLIPPSYGEKDFRSHQNRVGEAQAKAVTAAGVGSVVFLSSVGAQLPQATGPILGLHDQEKRLGALKTSVVHLRPAYFMENQLWNIGLIKGQGINGSPLKADVAIPMIATQDIAEAACGLLLKGFSGKSVRELLGPRDVSMAEATRILGAAIGKPDLKYVQFPYADAEKAMQGMGFSADLARLFIEMNRGFNDGIIRPAAKRSPESTTPTRLEDFAKVFAAAYKAS